jgi:Kef-type K+ transport system membrane component KefB/nucleotide-binding universal stress UspA family protein
LLLAAITPIGGHGVFLLLVQLALLLLVARLGAELCKRLSLPTVVGELAAGIVLGPSVLGHFAPGAFARVFPPDAAQFHLLEVVGTLGMVLLLLLTGLETDLRLLRNLGRAALIASVMGMVIPFATGFGLGLFMPGQYLAQPDRRLLFSSFLATAMAISAMPVIAKILMDLDLIKRNIGVVIMSAGVVDDTVGWLILSVIAGVASHGEVRVSGILSTLLLTGGFLVLAGAVLYPASRKIVSLVSRRFRAPDSNLVFMLILTLLCAAATEWIGVHAVFGAFIAGTVFRQVPELRGEAMHKLESFVFSVLAPVFFGTVGLKVDLWSLGGGGMLLIVLGIACFGKLVGCTVGSIWGGLRFWEGLSIAVAMNARGAMELVVATIGLSLGILNQQMFSIIVMVAILTSFMAPLGLRLTMRKVRMTDEEQRRILAAQSKGLFEPTRVRVLVPTVGGPNSNAAIALAAGLSRRSAHALEALSVKEPVSWSERMLRLFRARKSGDASSRPSAIHRALADAGLPPILRELSRDDVAPAILEEARKGFDFVVIGASSHAGWLGGPVLEDVVRKAPCHVAIVKNGGAALQPKRALVPFDGGVFSRVALEFAVRYAEINDADLTIAVLGEAKPDEARPDAGNPGEPLAAGEAPASDEELGAISPLLRVSTRRPRLFRVGPELFGDALLKEAASGNYDLIVLGAENRAIQHRLFFGADKERLIREAPVTVALMVPNLALLR